MKPTPYPAYKPSGVEWLGDVPAHWEQLPGRACYYEKKSPNTGMQETTVLSLSYGQIVIKPVEEHHGLVPASFETYQVIEPGDIIIRPTDLQNDWTSLRFGLSRHHGAITSAYMCFHTRGILSREYGHLLLHTYDLKKIFYGLGSGLRQNLNWRDFQYLPCLVPPLPEQNAIVRYLNHASERIRRYINAKEWLINLLEEQRRVIIHDAVTGRSDIRTGKPYPAYKSSGVEWLGEVPENWEVRKLHLQFGIQGSGTTPAGEQYFGGDIPWVVSGDLNNGVVYATSRTLTKRALDEIPALKVFPPNSLVIAMYGATVGKTGILSSGACTNQACCVLARPLYRTNPIYFQSVVISANNYLISQSVGGGQPNINAEIVRQLRVPVPPIIEQTAIVEYINKATTNIDKAIKQSCQEIELLKEYRTRLIADVVTGKLDVREAAFKLPEAHDELSISDKPELQSG